MRIGMPEKDTIALLVFTTAGMTFVYRSNGLDGLLMWIMACAAGWLLGSIPD